MQIGSQAATAFKIGAQDVDRIYVGSTLVFSAPTVPVGTPTYSMNNQGQVIRFFDSNDIVGSSISAGWAVFFEGDIEEDYHEIVHYTGAASLRVTTGNGAGLGRIRISNLSNQFYDTPADFSAGRVGIVVSFDGTTLNVWTKKPNESVVLSLSTATSFTTSKPAYGLQFYGWQDEIAPQTFPALLKNISATAFWHNGNSLTASQASDLLTGSKTVDEITPAPLVNMDFSNGGAFNKTESITAVRRAGDPAFVPLVDGTARNVYIMRDPETGEPVQQDIGNGLEYFGAANPNMSIVRSTDLTNWTTLQDITPLSGSIDNTASIFFNEFIYAGNEAGSHDPYMIWVVQNGGSSGTQGIHLYTSTDLVNWTADAANPVFNRTTVGTQVEDFRVVKLGSSNWAAYYEQEAANGPNQLCVGAAQNTNTVPTGSFTNVTDDILVDNDVIVGSQPFAANPGVTRLGNKVYLFYELVQFGSNGSFDVFGPAEFLRVADVEDALTPGAFEKRHCVLQRNAAEGHTLFANPTIVLDGVIYRGTQTKSVQTSPFEAYGYVEIDETVFGAVAAAPNASNAIADQTYTNGSAITPLDVAADFTGTAPITYALAPSSAALPAGLSLSSAGELTGTPTADTAQVNIVVRGTNAAGFADTAFGVTVQAQVVSAPSVINEPEISTVTETQEVTITQGEYAGDPAPTITWTVFRDGVDVTSNYTLANGVITGTPPDNTAGESFVYTETASNGEGNDITKQLTRTIQDFVAAVAPSFTETGTADYELAPAPRTIYVDYEAGSLLNDGTDPLNPAKLVPSGGVLAPGSTVVFKRGVKYRDPLVIQDIGQSGNPISYTVEPDGDFGTGDAILDGGVVQTGWGAAETVAGETVYRKAATFSATRRYAQDGTIITVAQVPAVPADNVYKVFGNTFTADSLSTDGSGNPVFTDADVFNDTYLLGISPVGSFLQVGVDGNFTELVEITAYDNSANTVTTAKPSGGVAVVRDEYAIYNHPLGLTLADGTYIYDRDTGDVLVRTIGDVDISTVEIVRVGGGTAINNEGEYVTIDGLTIQNWSGIAIRNQATTRRSGNINRNITAKNFVRDEGDSPGVISFYDQDDALLEDFTISDADGRLRGVMINGCTNTRAQRGTISKTTSSGLSLYGGTGASARFVTIEKPAGVHANGISVYTGAVDAEVAWCTVVLDQDSLALAWQDTDNFTAVFNTLASNGDSVVSNHTGTQDNGTRFSNNYVIKTGTRKPEKGVARADGPVLDPASTDQSVFTNNVWDGAFNTSANSADMLTYGKNAVFTKTPIEPEDIDATADRNAVFVDIDALNFDLAASPPSWITDGIIWTYESVTVDFVGRYDPADGQDIIAP